MAETPNQSTNNRLARHWTWFSSRRTLGADVERQTSYTEATAESNPTRASNKHPFYIEGEDCDVAPMGWPRVARLQNAVMNGCLHRRFGPSRTRVLHRREARIDFLEQRLLALDKEDEINNRAALRSLSRWQKEIEGDGGEDANFSEKEKVLQLLDKELGEYDEILLRDMAIRKAPLVERKEVENLYNSIVRKDILDEEGRAYLREIDDVTTTQDRTGYINNPLESLIYMDEGRLHGLIMKLFVKKNPNGTFYDSHVRNDRLNRAYNIIGVLIVLGLLLAPIEILYFLEPEKPASAAIVTMFAFAGIFMMAKVPGIRQDAMFVGMCAYMAVLGAFLANLQGSQRGGSI